MAEREPDSCAESVRGESSPIRAEAPPSDKPGSFITSPRAAACELFVRSLYVSMLGRVGFIDGRVHSPRVLFAAGLAFVEGEFTSRHHLGPVRRVCRQGPTTTA